MNTATAHPPHTSGLTIRVRYFHIVGLIFIWSLVGFPMLASSVNALGFQSTNIVIAVRAVIAGICLVLLLSGLLSKRAPKNFIFQALLVFFALYAIRLTVDTGYAPETLSRPSYLYWAFTFGVCLLPAIALAFFARHLDITRLYVPLIACAGLVLIIASFAGVTELEGSAGDVFDTGRLGLQSLNPISLGHVAVTTVILAYWRVRMMGGELRWKLLSCVPLILALYVLFASGSRGPLVALILGILFFEFVRGGRAAIVLAVLAAPILPSLAIDASALDSALGSNLFSRFETGLFAGDAASQGRLYQVSSAWDMFLSSPVFGGGLEDPTFGIYPHNIVVEGFMALGLFGGTLLIVLLGYTGLKAFQIARQDYALSLYGALFFQYLVGAQFSGSLYTSSVLWALLACIAGLQLHYSSSTSKQPSRNASVLTRDQASVSRI